MSEAKAKTRVMPARRGQNHTRAADQILTEIEGRTNQARKALAQLAWNALGIISDGFRQNQSPFLPWESLATKDGAYSTTADLPRTCAVLDTRGDPFHHLTGLRTARAGLQAVLPNPRDRSFQPTCRLAPCTLPRNGCDPCSIDPQG